MRVFELSLRQRRFVYGASWLVATVGTLLLCMGLRSPLPESTEVFFDGFVGEQATASDWTPETVDESPTGRRFLGRFGAETVALRVRNLPAHDSIEISFDLFVIASWDGNSEFSGQDRFQITVDNGPSIFLASFSSTGPESVTRQSYPLDFGEGSCPGRTGVSEVNSLGFLFRKEPHDSVYRITRAFDHDADEVLIQFAGLGLGPTLEDESWGLDNFSLATSTHVAPEQELSSTADCEPGAG